MTWTVQLTHSVTLVMTIVTVIARLNIPGLPDGQPGDVCYLVPATT